MNALRTILVVSLSLLSLTSFAQCEAKLKDFYVTYITNLDLCNDAKNIALKEAHMSPELINKLNERCEECGADTIIYAQDVCQNMIETLTVEPYKDNWYLVKYNWNPTIKEEETVIPVKACNCDGNLTILDIYPAWDDISKL
ncbi:MAG: hypothetical protein K2I50_04405 [Muribaculum sp.]|nr:hypothetical protein [Muribaculum sp.]